MALDLRQADDTITVTDSDLDEVFSPDTETTYTLRTLTSDKVRELRKPYVKTEFDKRTHRPVERPLTEDEYAAYTLDLLDYALCAWTGVHYHGEPVACSRDHKALLDAVRRNALLALAGMNRSTPAAEAARLASFRQPA
jgi:hypothetical protein